MGDQDYRMYPETSNVDLLLVSRSSRECIEAGDQIAIEAKMTANLKVLTQALPGGRPHTGPNYHAVLVPRASNEFLTIARRLRIIVFQAVAWDGTKELFKKLILPKPFRHFYPKPLWVPSLELKTEAGVPSPKSITPFKVAALRLCAIAEVRGWLTSTDFSEAGVSMSTWYSLRWVKNSGKKSGRYVQYIINTEDPRTPPPNIRYPGLYKQILDEYKRLKISPW